ncbi:MAG: serine hydrolase [Candidatus Promineifilaceae bacterium]|jgi:CubicO group peptidase (beta-lactamase class C family)
MEKIRRAACSLRGTPAVPAILILVLLLGAGCTLGNKQITSASELTIEQEMEAFVQAHVATRQFMGAALVARGDEVLFSKGFGMANLEWDVPNSPETVFRLGSLVKQFTAAAILQLQDQGLLSVTDPVSRYLPDFPHGDEITLHQLLNHSSGVPDLPEYIDLASHGPILRQAATLDELIGRAAGQPLQFAPGSQFQYSNIGYVMLGRIIEKVTGQSYATYLTEHIFQPLEMTATGYDVAADIVPHRAAGYTWDGSAYHNSEFIDMSNAGGAGGLISTAPDMYKWDRALYTDKVLSADARNAFFTPTVSMEPGVGYAYGWAILETPEHTMAVHSGGVNGFDTFVIRDPAEELYVIVLSNVENPDAQNVAEGLAAIAYGEPYELPQQRSAVELDPAIYTKYVGVYQLTPDIMITVTTRDGRLFARNGGNPEFEIYPESETDFFARVADLRLSFQVNADGTVTGMNISENGQELQAEKVE